MAYDIEDLIDSVIAQYDKPEAFKWLLEFNRDFIDKLQDEGFDEDWEKELEGDMSEQPRWMHGIRDQFPQLVNQIKMNQFSYLMSKAGTGAAGRIFDVHRKCEITNADGETTLYHWSNYCFQWIPEGDPFFPDKELTLNQK